MVIVSAEEEVLGSVDVLVAELVFVAVVSLLEVLLACDDLLVSCHGFLGWSAEGVKSVSYNISYRNFIVVIFCMCP